MIAIVDITTVDGELVEQLFFDTEKLDAEIISIGETVVEIDASAVPVEMTDLKKLAGSYYSNGLALKKRWKKRIEAAA